MIKRRIRLMLESIRDYRDEVCSIIVADPANADGFTVNKRIESIYDLKTPDGTVRRKLRVPGILIKDIRRFLRKPNTTVEMRMDLL